MNLSFGQNTRAGHNSRLWFMLPLVFCVFFLHCSFVKAQVKVQYRENFDTLLSYSLYPGNGWDTCANLYSSAPYSFRGQLPETTGDSVLLTSPYYDFSNCAEVFLVFEHICKISRQDIAAIEYREDYLGAAWRVIPPDCYRGSASAYRQNLFSAGSYSDWLSDVPLAQPDNRWWKTELFDLGSVLGYTKFQIRFKIKKGAEEGSQLQYGWLLDNISLYGGLQNSLPPLFRFADTVYADSVPGIGPFRVRMNMIGSQVAALEGYYEVEHLQYPAVFRQDDSADFAFVIPQSPFGTSLSYNVRTTDSAGNSYAVSRRFVNFMPDDGRDSIAVTLALLSPDQEIAKAGKQIPLCVRIKNNGIKPLTSLLISWQYNGVRQSFRWMGRLEADFSADSVEIGRFNVVEGAQTLQLRVKSLDGDSLLNPEDTLSYNIYGCTDFLHGSYIIGGKNADFPNLSSCLQVLSSCGMDGNCILLLDSGIYSVNFNLSDIAKSSENDTLLITSLSGKNSDVRFVADSGASELLSLKNVQNLYFQNITFVADSSDSLLTACVRLLDSCRHVGFWHCRFLLRNAETDAIFSSSRKGCRHVEVLDNVFLGGHSGVNISGRNVHDYQDFHVTGNCFESQTAYGIYFYCVDFQEISRNRFQALDDAAATYYNGINLYACFGEKIAQNAFNLRKGRYACCFTALYPLTHEYLQVLNNEIRFWAVQQQSAGLCVGSSCSKLYVAHNSILMSGPAYGSACVWNSGASDSIVWYNNLYAHWGNGNQKRIWEFGKPLQICLRGHQFDHNHYDISQGDISQGGLIYTDYMLTFEEWKSLTLQDANSVCGRVVFRDTAMDLQLAYPHVFCYALSSVEKDILDSARKEAVTQKGAYHNLGLFQNDAALFQANVYQNQGKIKLDVGIANVGKKDLEKVRVACKFDGTAEQLGVWTGILVTGDTVWLRSIAEWPLISGRHDVQIYLFSPNDTLDGNPYNDTLLKNHYGCDSVFSGCYTVGDSSSDFESLPEAIEALRCCGMRGDVYLQLQSGNYPTALSLSGPIPGSSDSCRLHITSLAASSDSVLLYADTTQDKKACITLSNVSNLVFEKISITGNMAAQTAFSVGVMLQEECNDIHFRQCRLTVKPVQQNVSMYSGIYAAESSGETLYVRDCHFENGQYGVNLQGMAGGMLRKVSLLNNIFSLQSEYSVYLKRLDFDSLSGNRAANFSLENVQGNVVAGNYLHAVQPNRTVAFYLEDVSPMHNELLVANNECITVSDQTHYGIVLGPFCNRISFLHNSICALGKGEAHCFHLQLDGTFYGIAVRENVMANYSTSTNAGNCNVCYINRSASPSAYQFACQLDNNLYAGTPNFYTETTALQLSNWQSLYNQDLQSHYVRLHFTDSTSCLQLEEASFSESFLQPQVLCDINGKPRTFLTCKGAYAPLSRQTDALLFQWISPSGKVGKQNYAVKVVLGNMGDSLLREVRIHWRINQVYQSDYLWQGSLSKGDTAHVLLGYLQADSSMELCAYINLANGIKDNNPFNDTLVQTLMVCDSSWKGTYRIGQDFADLNECLMKLRHCDIAGPLRILLPSGLYEGPFLFDHIRSDYPIVFTSDAADSGEVIFCLSSGSQASQVVLTCTQTKNVILEHFTFRVPNASYGILLRFRNEDLQIRNCRFIQGMLSNAAICQKGDGYLKNVSICDNYIIGGDYGVWLQASSSQWDTSVSICRNTISDINGYGISLRYVLWRDISHNVISQTNKSSQGFYGISLENAKGEKLCANRISASRGYYGIYLSAVTATESDILVANNEIRMQVYSSNCGIYLYNGCNHIDFYHNSVLLYGNGQGKCFYTAFSLYNISLKNNHLVNLSKNNSSIRSEVLYFYSSSGVNGWEMENNCYYSVGPYLHYAGGEITTLSDWKLLTGKDRKSVCLPPIYMDRSQHLKLSDYDSLSCPMLSEVTIDLEGKERGETTCMGAYQANPDLQVDMHLLSFVDPMVSDSVCYGVRLPIRVKLRNEGSDTLFFDRNPLTVGFQVSGAAYYQDICVFQNGWLAPLQSDTFTLTEDFIAIQAGVYSIRAFISDNVDNNHSNDTIELNLPLLRTLLPFGTNTSEDDAEISFQSLQGGLNWYRDTTSCDLAAVYGGSKFCFPSSRGRGAVARLLFQPMDLSGLRQPLLSIWYAHNENHKSDGDQLRLLVSTDGGTQWQTVRTLYRYQKNAGGSNSYRWQRYDVDLSSYAQSCVRIALEAVSYGGGNQYIDSIAIVGDAFLQIKNVLYPQSVNNCQLDQPDLKMVLSNSSAQPLYLDSATCYFSGTVAGSPLQISHVLYNIQMEPFRQDTVCLASAFWKLNSEHRFNVSVVSVADSLSDSLSLVFNPLVDIVLQNVGVPPCVAKGDSITPSVSVWNRGVLHVGNIPIMLQINDSLYCSDSIGMLQSGDSLRFMFRATAPFVQAEYYDINILSPLECDDFLENNSLYATACLSIDGISPHASDSNWLRIYPNPVSDYLHVEVGNESESANFNVIKGEIIIVNSVGMILYQNPAVSGLNRIDLHGWASGCYFLLFKSEKGSRQYLFVKD